MKPQRALGLAGLFCLSLVAIPLAAPGPGLVPAAGGSGPDWLLGIFGGGLGISPGLYYGLLWLSFGAYLCVLPAAPAIGRRLLWYAACALVALFVLAPPLLSQDVFSYIDYARLGAVHHANPYSHAPVEFARDPAFPYLGWPDSTSAYGPLFTLLTYPLAWVSVPVALWALKAVAGIAVLGLAALVGRAAPSRGLDPARALALVAFNPLVLVHVVGGAHNDAVAIAIAVAGCAAVLAGREASGGAALVAAAALKLSSAFAFPFALLGASAGRRGTRRVPARARGLLLGAALALAAIGSLSVACFGWHWLDTFALAGENQSRVSNYSLPNLLAELFGVDVDAMRALGLTAYLGLFAGLLALVWRGRDWVWACGWAALGLLIASAWLLPWYLIWALPFAALARDSRLVAAVLGLTALQLAARVPL